MKIKVADILSLDGNIKPGEIKILVESASQCLVKSTFKIWRLTEKLLFICKWDELGGKN